MAMDMRALYYIAMYSGKDKNEDAEVYKSLVKANENCLNQNFTILSQKIAEFEARISALENL